MTSTIKFPPTYYTEQEIMNMGLDSKDVAPTSLRGSLQFAEGLGWMRTPVKGTFPYEQYDYTSGNLDYAGFNTDITAADADTDWLIFKYEWSAGNCVKIRMRITSWTDRATGW
jgi:hypothetical protein